MTARRFIFWFALMAAAGWLALELEARVGGGGGYSGGGGGGGSSSGGGGGGGSSGGGDGEAIFWLIYYWILLCWHYPYIGLPATGLIIWWVRSNSDNVLERVVVASRIRSFEPEWKQLRALDENFSVVLFRDFAYSLFAKLHEARGSGLLSGYKQFLNDEAVSKMDSMSANNLKDVQGVIVGALKIERVNLTRIKDTPPQVIVHVVFDANFTEIRDEETMAVYTRQKWVFKRRADVLSPPPEKITALDCAGCGSPVETGPDGACQHCGGTYPIGEHHWAVVSLRESQRRLVPPALTSSAEEVGTDLPTVIDPNYAETRAAFQVANPSFDEERTLGRFQEIFLALQAAWGQRDLAGMRPYESDNLFQNHRYWVEEYIRQDLRNVLEDVSLDGIEMVKITTDKFYDAITCRMRAHMKEYTIDSDGRVVCGSPMWDRHFTEYWTFIRGRGAGESAHDHLHCPNCGAELKISMAGDCEYCDSKVTSGNFDWVASEIQQDEDYRG